MIKTYHSENELEKHLRTYNYQKELTDELDMVDGDFSYTTLLEIASGTVNTEEQS